MLYIRERNYDTTTPPLLPTVDRRFHAEEKNRVRRTNIFIVSRFDWQIDQLSSIRVRWHDFAFLTVFIERIAIVRASLIYFALNPRRAHKEGNFHSPAKRPGSKPPARTVQKRVNEAGAI